MAHSARFLKVHANCKGEFCVENHLLICASIWWKVVKNLVYLCFREISMCRNGSRIELVHKQIVTNSSIGEGAGIIHTHYLSAVLTQTRSGLGVVAELLMHYVDCILSIKHLSCGGLSFLLFVSLCQSIFVDLDYNFSKHFEILLFIFNYYNLNSLF